jgi:hypothetical protein
MYLLEAEQKFRDMQQEIYNWQHEEEAKTAYQRATWADERAERAIDIAGEKNEQ